MPIEPTPDTLSYFVTFMSHHIQPRSVEAYLSGIVSQLEPHFPEVHKSRHLLLVRRTMRGALHSLGRPVNRRLPLLRDDLLRVYNDLAHPLTHDDLLWVVQLHCGFFGLLRLGELVVPDDPSLTDFTKAHFGEGFFFELCLPDATRQDGHAIAAAHLEEHTGHMLQENSYKWAASSVQDVWLEAARLYHPQLCSAMKWLVTPECAKAVLQKALMALSNAILNLDKISP
ncbi:hypothetical protein EV702DRAFT_1204711 [Suillus placidus]|uniref:Uncharacterized protein n=1 Tax=Suillus placidus TaxID=48579 RepID=A0A9P7CV96_9AGAM|nr:hypothetical protein EV702DRAFT_1204711 [Suillus placidus]